LASEDRTKRAASSLTLGRDLVRSAVGGSCSSSLFLVDHGVAVAIGCDEIAGAESAMNTLSASMQT